MSQITESDFVQILSSKKDMGPFYLYQRAGKSPKSDYWIINVRPKEFDKISVARLGGNFFAQGSRADCIRIAEKAGVELMPS